MLFFVSFWPLGEFWLHFDRDVGVLDMIVSINFFNIWCWLNMENSVSCEGKEAI